VEALIPLVLLLVVLYVLMIRPQRQRQQQMQKMIDNAAVGDDILTSGGIYGTITEVEGDDIVVEIADGLNVHMTRRGIAAVLPPEEDEEEDEAADEDEVDAVDEASVTEREDVVTSETGADATSGDRR
jgi:preprotein translocase subunit YajC